MAETSIGHRLTKFNVNDAPANARGTVHPINLARRANQRVRDGHSQLQQAKANAIISALDRAGVYFDENRGVFLREPVANDQ